MPSVTGILQDQPVELNRNRPSFFIDQKKTRQGVAIGKSARSSTLRGAGPPITGEDDPYHLRPGGLLVGFSLVAAVIVNYIKQDDIRGTWLESHFRWQIRTFWFTLLWAALGGLTFVFVIGFFILVADGIWLVYRIAKGWIFLNEKKQMYAASTL